MALKDQVFAICQELAKSGWAELLKAVTASGTPLDLNQATAEALETALLQPLVVDRAFPGFEDFAMEGKQGITPGKPARSLLYHALASPNVIWENKQRTTPLTVFPTLEQLEIVENYVFGMQPPSFSFLKNLFPGKELALVVFANQYRTAVDTPHTKHADLVYARTGISRVGNAPQAYNPQTRSFNALDDTNPNKSRILPAKYNVYLAVKLNGSKELLGKRFNTGLQLFDTTPTDEELFFWYPVHKVFAGDECFQNVGKPVSFEYGIKHLNEKIKRVHKFLIDKFELNPGSDIEQFSRPPFTGTNLATADRIESAAFVLPTVTEALVQRATNPENQPVTLDKKFPLPSTSPGGATLRRFSSSLELRSVDGPHGNPRQAPEYLHIRTELAGNAENDLNARPDLFPFLDSATLYKALHYTDSTGDGYVTITGVTGVPGVDKIVPAYSIVAAPDFFPLVEQAEVLNQTIKELDIWSRTPLTIADTRLLPNISTHPELKGAKNEIWDTVTALIAGTMDAGIAQTRFSDKSEARVSYLTDGAAGIFAPGWDTSFDVIADRGANIPHLAAYGLGSPFPEDSKLCAALSSFWPAVAPDITRSFWPENGFSPTVVPLLDSEIGAHNTGTSWDGENGPTLVTRENKKFLRYKKIEYVDYTLNALQNKFNFHILGRITAIEYISRLKKMKAAKDLEKGVFNDWLFSSYTQVDASDPDVQQAINTQNVSLTPTIHKFIFVQQGSALPVPENFQLVEVEVTQIAIVLVDAAEKVVLVGPTNVS